MNIGIVTNPTQFPWSPHHLDALGAGEEAVVLLARALRRRGHIVTVYYDGPEEIDVVYVGGDEFVIRYRPRATGVPGTHEVAIFHNVPAVHGFAAQQIFWTYQADRAFDPGPFAHAVVATPYVERCLTALVPAAAGMFTVIPYGCDPQPTDVEKDAGLVVHASSPDRGLSTLLDCWPAVVAAHPQAQLAIAYGWELYEACGGSPALRAEIEAKIAATTGVTMRRYTSDELDDLYARAGVWAYYCTGGEVFCLTGVKAQDARCVPVVRPWGGLHDTVRGGLTATDPETFTAALIEALDPERQERLREALPDDVAIPWTFVVEQWVPLFTAPAASRSSRVMQTPATPATLQHDASTLQVQPALQQLMSQWAASVGAQRPAADPCLGVQFPPITGMPDAVVMGWTLEDADEPIATTLRKLQVPKGTPILCLASTGPWRAAQRQRHLTRRDLAEIFGMQPDIAMRCTTLGADGNGIFAVSFRFDPDTIGHRNVRRVRASAAPRERVSVCLIVRNNEDTLRKALVSAVPIADEFVIIDTGSTDRTPAVVAQFQTDYPDVPVVYRPGTSPRYCYDCQAEHSVGEMAYGHRFAGFETPRNESITAASGDWVLWLDSDETLLHPERLAKYLRPSTFAGFAIAQDHHASDPANAYKRDLPVRLFRRVVDPHDEPGLRADGPHKWPTYHTGLTVRFSGIVHEHPGLAPTYAEGLGPVMVVGDVWISHSGYLTEAMRRGRFVRNWPLMVADRQKYPARRLGLFLWLRDLTHHVRYELETHGNQMTPMAAQLAEDGIALFRQHFLASADLLSGDALGYVTVLLQAMGRGIEVNATVAARKPEASGEETDQAVIQGRVETPADLLALLTPRLAGWERWTGDFL